MKKSLFILIAFTAVTFVASIETANAQRAWFRGNVRENIRNIERDTDVFKRSLNKALDRSSINGTKAEDEINGYVKEFEKATDRLRDRAEDRDFAPNAAREVLNRGRVIDAFMRRVRLGNPAESDWRRVRNGLDRLANSYYVTWSW